MCVCVCLVRLSLTSTQAPSARAVNLARLRLRPPLHPIRAARTLVAQLASAFMRSTSTVLRTETSSAFLQRRPAECSHRYAIAVWCRIKIMPPAAHEQRQKGRCRVAGVNGSERGTLQGKLLHRSTLRESPTTHVGWSLDAPPGRKSLNPD